MPKTARVKITQRMVDALKPVAKETWLMDAEVVKLGIRQRPGTVPVWALRYKLRDSGRDKRVTLWNVKTLSVEDARKIALQRLGEIAETGDVIDRRLEARKRETVSEMVARVLAEMEAKGKAKTYVRDFRNQCATHVEPHIGSSLVRDVNPSDIDRVLNKLRDRPYLHNRVRANLSKLFSVARRDRIRVDSPVFGSERTHEEARERVLDDAEMKRLLAALEANPGTMSDAVRLLYLTGSRPKELLRSQWKDFDVPKDAEQPVIWNKPAQTVKQRRTHTVELSALAGATLRRMREDQEAAGKVKDDAYVFPSKRKADAPQTEYKDFWAKVAKEAGLDDARPYDLRKSFASRVLAAGVDIKTAMSLTGHTQSAVFLKHYAKLVKGKQGEALSKVAWV